MTYQYPIRGSFKPKPILPPNPIKIATEARQKAEKTAEDFELHIIDEEEEVLVRNSKK